MLVVSHFTFSVTCAPGWKKFGEKCFYFGMNETIGNYSSGVDMCHSLNSVATLASIHSKAELDWIIGNLLH